MAPGLLIAFVCSVVARASAWHEPLLRGAKVLAPRTFVLVGSVGAFRVACSDFQSRDRRPGEAGLSLFLPDVARGSCCVI